MVGVCHPLDKLHGFKPAEADKRVGLDQLRQVRCARLDVVNYDRKGRPERALTEGQQVIVDHSK
jgi:hypothetical protein